MNRRRSYRHDFAVLHPYEPRLLALRRGDRAILPRYHSAEWAGTDELLAALRTQGVGAAMLRPACRWNRDDEATMLYVLEAPSSALPARARWFDLGALRAGAVSYSEPGALETVLR